MNIMRKLRRHGALAGTVAAIALAIIPGAAQAETTLRVGNMGEPASLDPHYVSGTWENRIVGDMFLGLTTEGPDGKTYAGAAESWTVSDDGLVYTFKLRDHVWSDGTPVTAEDFVKRSIPARPRPKRSASVPSTTERWKSPLPDRRRSSLAN
jgi:oligopeptide transport system substrate-binding protein